MKEQIWNDLGWLSFFLIISFTVLKGCEINNEHEYKMMLLKASINKQETK